MRPGEFHFHRLARLASEHGLDVRATVLRVATDLFCQNPAQTPAEIVRYTDLASALLTQVDSGTRRIIAGKLATAPHAPEKLLRLLLDDTDVTVAAAIIEKCPALQLENFATFLSECGPAEAAAIARRADIDRETTLLLASHPNMLVVETLIENRDAHFDAATAAQLVARVVGHPELAALLLTHPGCELAALAPLYPLASPETRLNIRTAIEERPARSLPPVPIQAALELNEAIGGTDADLAGIKLSKALHLDPSGIRRVLDDPTGELLILALAAAGIKRAPAIRFLLTSAVESVRLSVERVFTAADVFDTTSRRVARELAVAVSGEHRMQGGTFEPHMHPSETPIRSFGTRRRLQVPKRPARRADITGTTD